MTSIDARRPQRSLECQRPPSSQRLNAVSALVPRASVDRASAAGGADAPAPGGWSHLERAARQVLDQARVLERPPCVPRSRPVYGARGCPIPTSWRLHWGASPGRVRLRRSPWSATCQPQTSPGLGDNARRAGGVREVGCGPTDRSTGAYRGFGIGSGRRSQHRSRSATPSDR